MDLMRFDSSRSFNHDDRTPERSFNHDDRSPERSFNHDDRTSEIESDRTPESESETDELQRAGNMSKSQELNEIESDRTPEIESDRTPEIESETDELQRAGNMSKSQELNASSSSSEVDFVKLCEDIAEKIKNRRIVLNRKQCEALARKLSLKIACIREVVESCERYKHTFVLLLKALYRYYEKAEELVEKCGEEDWCKAAVSQIGNTASFSYIVRHINIVGRSILECATKDSAVNAPSTVTMQSAFPLDEAESCGAGELEDEKELRMKLEGVASERKKSLEFSLSKKASSKQRVVRYFLSKKSSIIAFLLLKKASSTQHLARYLLKKIKFKYLLKLESGTEPHKSKALKSILWEKKNESAGTWGKFESLRYGSGRSLRFQTTWLGVPCARKVFDVSESRMFRKEASLMARLKYPCLVDFICCGYGDKKGAQFIAMELMEKSLFDLIEERKGTKVYFSFDVALDIIWQMADGVRFLHEAYVAHSRLEPKNVVVRTLSSLYHEDYYCVKLVDFGAEVKDGIEGYTTPKLHDSETVVMYKVGWFKKDAYDFAMTCAHILTLTAPFENLSLDDIKDMVIKDLVITKGQRPNFKRACDELFDLLNECWSQGGTRFSIICERLENIILNSMLMPFHMSPPKNMDMGVDDIKEVIDQIKEEGLDTTFFTSQEDSIGNEVVSTRRESNFDESGLQNLIGKNLVIDLSSDLLSVTPSGYVIRTSFTSKGVIKPCVLKRCDVVDQNPPDLARLQHPHVVHLFDFWFEEKYLFLVMEALDGDLAMLIPWTKSVSLHVAVDIMLQIATGILYLHEIGVSYSLKCDNVLYKLTDRNKTEAFRVGDLVVKLGGFGCPRPRHLESESQDAFDFGLTCLDILTGNRRSDKIVKLSIPETTPPILKGVIVSCLETRPMFSTIVEELGRARSEILRTYKSDDFVVPSHHMEPEIVQTKTDCDPEEGSLIHQIFAVHQLHPLGDTCTSIRATLVFFHGFCKVPEEWRRTWMTHDNKLVWPQKWLPEDLGAENIRVLSVSFDENSTVSNNCIRDEMGKNLVKSVLLSPEWKLGESGEAIFLIGHSFGGVLIKYLVTEARHLVQNNTGHQEALRCAKFFERLAKIVFYSVPHASTGQEFENYVSRCKKIAPLKRSSFLQSLEGDKLFVEDMIKLSTDFESALPEKLQILAFLEGKAMSEEFVLITEKSCEGASSRWEWHKIDKDNHFEVCRPGSKEHTGYKILLKHLRQHLNDHPYGETSSAHDSHVTRMHGKRQSDDLSTASEASEAFPAKNLSVRAEGSSESTILSTTPEHSTPLDIDPHSPSDRRRESQSRFDIFLSHSGAQKNFTEQLCADLERHDYHPFFDKRHDSLPIAIGRTFPDLIFQAIHQCDVAILILSEDFFTRSTSPMLELEALVEAQKRNSKKLFLLPVYLGISPNEFKNEARQLQWLSKWKKWAACDGRINVVKWKDALKVLYLSNGIEYMQSMGEVMLREHIVSAIQALLPPQIDQGTIGSLVAPQIQGSTRICKAIIEKIEKTKPSQTYGVRVLGLYGMGGVGKTTFCKVLCNELFSKFHGKVCHAELGMRSSFELLKQVLKDLTSFELLKQVLKDLTGMHHGSLTVLTDKEMATNLAIAKRICQPVFLALDNVSKGLIKEARGYLELCAHEGSIVMVTARSIELLTSLNIDKSDCFEMPELEEEDAKHLFLQHLAPGVQFLSEDDEQKILYCIRQCKFHNDANKGEHYHPLALKVLGAQLGSLGLDPQKWRENLSQETKFDRSTLNHPIFDIFRRSFNSLSEEDQLFFMDIVLFYSSQRSTDFHHVDMGDMRQMSNLDIYKWLSIVYGEDKIVKSRLQGLKAKSLLEDIGDGSHDGVSVHALYLEFIEKEVESGAWDNWVCYNGEDAHYVDFEMIRWEDLKRVSLKYDATYHDGWRILMKEIKRGAFYNIGVLQLLIGGIEVLDVGSLPNLRCLVLKWGYHDNRPNRYGYLIGLTELRNLGWLELCNVQYASFTEIEWLTALKVLRLCSERWKKLKRGLLPPLTIARLPNLHRLTKLQVLELDCIPIKSLPSLKPLTQLIELRCTETQLTELPDLSELSLLESIDLRSCRKLTSLDNFGNLPALRHLNVSACHKLQRLPDLRSSKELRFLILSRSGIRLFSKDIAVLAESLDINVLVSDDVRIELLGDVGDKYRWKSQNFLSF